MEHARCDVGARAKEHRGISEQLLDPWVLGVFLRKGHNRRGQQGHQRHRTLQNRRNKERPEILERGVQKILFGHSVGLFGRVEVALHGLPVTGLHRLQQVEVVLPGCTHVDVLCGGRTLWLKINPVAGVEFGEGQVLFCRAPHQSIPVVKDLWHEIPGGTGIEAETVFFP